MAESTEPEPRSYCTYCGLEIENRSEPNMGGPSRDNWVHVPGGHTVCFPQRAATSPRAMPAVPYRPDCPVCRAKPKEATP